ncbi:DeSI-like protein sdu1 [Paramyrothecium foliicola]|nr:DeSI-like protein sdu1 [Paramyrothecium foliicola]
MAPSNGSGQGTSRHRSTLSMQKTEITIHVYDLLPVRLGRTSNSPVLTAEPSKAGRLSSVLWNVGASLLHSGVVINGKEYAYGGHQRRGLTGVYWTKPGTEPPGGTFRCEILHGFTLATEDEIEATIRAASDEFLGTSYNILTKNCNHFTSYLCRRLTGTPAPGWLNRAASIGVALPCMVPKEWIAPPEYDTADGELLDDDENTNEQSHMLGDSRSHLLHEIDRDDWRAHDQRYMDHNSSWDEATRDAEGRRLPAAERAPQP